MYKPHYEQQLAIAKSNMNLILDIEDYLSKVLSDVDPKIVLEIQRFFKNKKSECTLEYNYAFDKMLCC